ncbi:serine/threonine-protein kinase [Thermophilibacter provencensis]|uniref:serine/threonine-protein kinase n=1 Tax=Thermophilibacter provencensis TaxID=1852386 RepID=UPI002942DD62|nr:serine/threonine-protein kinase [Thermophilibacter provencensis]
MSEPADAPRAAQQQTSPREEILLGRYRVLARRGTGGFGTVCTCWDLRLQRRVAIKRLPILDDAATTTADEALAEARTACMLGHPNIVTVFDFESDGAYAYIVMEYVDGLNLAELLARVEGGRLTCEECAQVLDSVARALEFAHENRVLHLDIKPTNIMIDRQGVVKLADFGMATLASAAGYGGARGGTVGYMPPEQIEGMLVDERSDVFSLAVVLWQALSGACPFAADSAAASLRLIERGPRRPLSRDCPELAGDPELVLADALAPQASARPADVREFADELLSWMGDPHAGAASLRELVDQAEKDDGSTAALVGERPPIALRLPWLPSAIGRAVTALATFATVRLALPALLGPESGSAAAASLACAVAAAAWPPLGGALGGLTLAAALGVTARAPSSFPLAAAVAAATLAWWASVGRRERLGGLAVLLPCCLPTPVAGAGVAGYAFDPGPAAVTGAVGYLLGSLFGHAVDAGFSATVTVAALIAEWASPAFWAVCAGAALCGAVSSAVALRGSVAAGVCGQILGLCLLVGSEVIAASMENAGIWNALDWEAVVIAVLLTVLLCIATVLRGPLFEDLDDEDGYHELPQ